MTLDVEHTEISPTPEGSKANPESRSPSVLSLPKKKGVTFGEE
jgi:hypothetical protein